MVESSDDTNNYASSDTITALNGEITIFFDQKFIPGYLKFEMMDNSINVKFLQEYFVYSTSSEKYSKENTDNYIYLPVDIE